MFLIFDYCAAWFRKHQPQITKVLLNADVRKIQMYKCNRVKVKCQKSEYSIDGNLHDLPMLFVSLSFKRAVCSTCWLTAGVAARETAQALRTLAQAARGVAASTKEPQAAAAMLDSAQYVMEGSAMLIHEAHQALVHPGDAESQQRLAQVGRLPPPLVYHRVFLPS